VGDVLERLAALRNRGIPTVLVDRVAEDHALPSVSVDDVAGGNLAASHLIEGGRRRLAFVGGTAGIRQVADRLAGARAAVQAHPGTGLEIVHTSAMTVGDGIEVGNAIGARAAADRPDAIFAVNDLVALGVMQAMIVRHGIRIPEDIALIGYDDIDFASSSIVALSSIRQPAREIGYRAMHLLLSGAPAAPDARDSVVFQPELIARASTRPSK
jgi:LacI family transcriptional regulator